MNGKCLEINSAVGVNPYFDGLVQERRNSSALAMEFRLSCTKPSIYLCCFCGETTNDVSGYVYTRYSENRENNKEFELEFETSDIGKSMV